MAVWRVASADHIDVHLKGPYKPVRRQSYCSTFTGFHTSNMEQKPGPFLGGTAVDIVQQPGRPVIKLSTDHMTDFVQIDAPGLALQAEAVVVSKRQSPDVKGQSPDVVDSVLSSKCQLVFVQTLDAYTEKQGYGAKLDPASVDFCLMPEMTEQDRQFPVLDARTLQDQGLAPTDTPYYSCNATASFNGTVVVRNNEYAAGQIYLKDSPNSSAALAISQRQVADFLDRNNIQGSVFYLKQLIVVMRLTSWLCIADEGYDEKVLYPLMSFNREVNYGIRVTQPASVKRDFRCDFTEKTPLNQWMPVFHDSSYVSHFPERVLHLSDSKSSHSKSSDSTFFFANNAFNFKPMLCKHLAAVEEKER